MLGTVVGAEETDLAPQVMARVLEVKVREGAVVQTGQLLARLDEREFQDAVTEAEAALAAGGKRVSGATRRHRARQTALRGQGHRAGAMGPFASRRGRRLRPT